MKKNNTIKVTCLVENPDVSLFVDGEGAFLIDTSVTGKITVTRFNTDLAYCADEKSRNGYVDAVTKNKELLAIDTQELDTTGFAGLGNGSITVTPVNAIIVTTEDSGSEITEFTLEQPNNDVELLNEGQYLFAISNGACHVRQIDAAAGGGVSKEYVDAQVATRNPKLYSRLLRFGDANNNYYYTNILLTWGDNASILNLEGLGYRISYTGSNGYNLACAEGYIKIEKTGAAASSLRATLMKSDGTSVTLTTCINIGTPYYIGYAN